MEYVDVGAEMCQIRGVVGLSLVIVAFCVIAVAIDYLYHVFKR